MAGKLIWITGLSNSGKTTVGKLLYNKIKSRKKNVVFLDGDILRSVTQNHDYSIEARRASFYHDMQIAKLLIDQDIDVVISQIAMRNEFYTWTKDNFPDFMLVYLKVPMDILVERDTRGIYSQSQVYGVDLPYDEPQSASIIVNNYGDNTAESVANYIYKSLSF